MLTVKPWGRRSGGAAQAGAVAFKFPRPFLLCLLFLFWRAVGWAGEPSQANSFFAFCMDTHDARNRSLSAQAELLKELGYAGAGHLWLDQLTERMESLDAAGLRLFQIYLRVDLKAVGKPAYDPRLKQILPQLKGRGTMLALLISGGRPSDRAGDARAVEILGEMADMARPWDVSLALYPHTGDWLERVEDAIRLVKQLNRTNVGVMFNLCHWMKMGEEKELKPLLRTARPHLIAVSINGCDRVADVQAGHGQWIAPLDTGTFDMFDFLTTLRGLDYAGPIGLQCYGIAGDARDHLTRSIKAWRELTRRLAQQAP